MKNIIFILAILLCSFFAIQDKAGDSEILGRWCSTLRNATYPHLTFKQDGYVLFDCKIDTFFARKYIITGNELLFSSKDKLMDKSSILKLTKDTLILATLLENKTVQVYYRCR
jgi:hypothetical protein